jgi:hypothetical protein
MHCESERIIQFFGDDELARLGRIDHLGAATPAFPGINHKRLEYVLLQCAIAQIVAKLYKDNPDLALANTVELSGTSSQASSPGRDCRVEEMCDLRETTTAADTINHRFYAANPLIRTMASDVRVNDR